MHVLGKSVLWRCCGAHADLRRPAAAWLTKVELSTWLSPQQLKKSFPAASLIDSKRAVFNLKGNRYRLLARVDFRQGIVLIDRVATHSEYSRWKLR
jgi:mRNA interferase HigB